MADQSKIEWTDSTFNPWIGCTKISPACDHCYAERSTPSRTMGIAWGSGAERLRTSSANWKLPLRWNNAPFRQCKACGWRGEPKFILDSNGKQIGLSGQCLHCGKTALAYARRRVFCASLADVFDNEVDPQWRADLWELIARTPNLDWLILTKRIGNARAMLPVMDSNMPGYRPWAERWPWSHVRIGATVANQDEADRDLTKLLSVPAAGYFVSIEPMLGPINFRWAPYAHQGIGQTYRQYLDEKGTVNEYDALRKLDWVIVGGESGPGARPMHPNWARSLRDQCISASVPFFFKQWGEYVHHEQTGKDLNFCYEHSREGGWIELDGSYSIGETAQPKHVETSAHVFHLGKRGSGYLLDGVEHKQFPVHRLLPTAA
jgi:protein gp37